MPSSWHHWNHLPGDSADKCQNQLQRAFPQAACFFSSCWMSRLERPQGVNSHQLHKRSYTTIIIFPPGREASKSTGCNLVLNTKHGQLAGSQLNRFEKSALMCVPTISSHVVGQTCSYTIWLTVIRRCQFKSLACDQCKRTHAFSWFQTSATQAFPLLFCLLHFFAYAFCVLHQTCMLDLHTITTPVCFELESESKGLIFYSVALRFGIICDGVFVLNKYWSLTICTFLNLVEVEAKHSKCWPCFKKKCLSSNTQLQRSRKKTNFRVSPLRCPSESCSLQRPFHKERFPPKSLRWAYILMNLGWGLGQLQTCKT